MVFASLLFLLLFFPLTLIVYYLLPKRLRNLWLLIASLAFYASGEPRLILLFLAEILWNWAGALALAHSGSCSRKRLILVLCLMGDLGVLTVFKYSAFFVQNLCALFGTADAAPDLSFLVLPIGISFYTFQEISYVVDVYRGETPRKNLVDVALYFSFFPQLIAGPIVRYEIIAPQLRERQSDWEGVSRGFIRFCRGLCKKVLLANNLGVMADSVFGTTSPLPFSAPVLWLAVFAYSLQLFFDFSGYSDMAIGLGTMFGFRLPENFRDPYTAKTAKELWSRWHITLFAWFRDYVYIPLGGSRAGKGKTIRNLLLVWTLTGLWHGANWTFILWGLCWGLLVTEERFRFRPESRGRGFQLAYRFLLGTVTALLWGVFRSPNLHFAFGMLGRMFSPAAWALCRTQFPMLRMWWHEIWIYFLASVLLAFCFPQRLIPALLHGEESPAWLDALGLVGLALCTVLAFSFLVNGSYNPFLYFQF